MNKVTSGIAFIVTDFVNNNVLQEQSFNELNHVMSSGTSVRNHRFDE